VVMTLLLLLTLHSQAQSQTCTQTMPMATGDTAGCTGFLTSKTVLRGCLGCNADLKLCRVKAGQAEAVSLLTECSLPNDGVSPLTATLLAVTSLTVGLIVGWALSPDYSMP
jgi:hypothetical protein